jgi:hypothetical protein
MSGIQSIKTIPPISHSTIVTSPNLTIPLRLNGIMSYFETCRPSKYELDYPDLYPQIIMTYNSPTWDPYDSEFARVEAACRSQLEALPDPRNLMLSLPSIAPCSMTPLLHYQFLWLNRSVERGLFQLQISLRGGELALKRQSKP